MDTETFLARLASRDLHLSCNGDSLRLVGQAERITDKIRLYIRMNKPALLEALRVPRCERCASLINEQDESAWHLEASGALYCAACWTKQCDPLALQAQAFAGMLRDLGFSAFGPGQIEVKHQGSGRIFIEEL